MKEIREIKKLKSELNNMQAEAEDIKIELSIKQGEYNNKLKLIKEIKEQLTKLNGSSSIKVSEHAIVRYFERVKGFDLAEIEKEILSSEVIKLVETLGGNGTYPNNGFAVMLKNYTVTTILKK